MMSANQTTPMFSHPSLNAEWIEWRNGQTIDDYDDFREYYDDFWLTQDGDEGLLATDLLHVHQNHYEVMCEINPDADM